MVLVDLCARPWCVRNAFHEGPHDDGERWVRQSATRALERQADYDPVNHPQHYVSHPSGVECIEITEHMGFCVGNAIKYIWRADEKNGLEDLRKAVWYLEREIERRARAGTKAPKS